MIFSFYSHSAKQLRELESIADKLKVKLNKFGSLHQCRWVASQLRALNSLHQNYRATCDHFQTLIEEGSKDAAKVSGILIRLRSPKFVTFFLFMRDFIQVIITLSKLFQEENVLIVCPPTARSSYVTTCRNAVFSRHQHIFSHYGQGIQ